MEDTSRVNRVLGYLVIYSLYAPLLWLNQPQVTVSFFFYFFILTAIFTVFINLLFFKGKKTISGTAVEAAIILMVSGWMISSITAIYPRAAFLGNMMRYESIMLYFSFIVFFYLGAAVYQHAGSYFKSLAVTGSIIFLLTLIQKYSAGVIDLSVIFKGRASGIFTSALVMGVFIALVYPVCFIKMIHESDKYNRLLYGAATILSVLAALASESRTALAIIIIFTSIYLLKSVTVIGKTKQRRAAVAVALTLLMFCVFAPTMERLAGSAGESMKGRMVIYRISARATMQNPWFGNGINNYPIAYLKNLERADLNSLGKRYPEIVYHAHNIFLDTTAQTGLFGLFSLLVFLTVLLSRAFKAKKPTGSETEILVYSIFLYLFSLLICWSITLLNVMFWFFCGLLYGSLGTSGKAGPLFKITLSLKKTVFPARVVSGVLLVFALFFTTAYIASEISYSGYEKTILSSKSSIFGLPPDKPGFYSNEDYHWYFASLNIYLLWREYLPQLTPEEKINGIAVMENKIKKALALNLFNPESELLYGEILKRKQQLTGEDLSAQREESARRLLGMNPMLLELR